MNPATIRSLLNLLARLKSAHIFYTLVDHTEGAIMIEASVPGERWEIEFHEDGHVGVEIFVTNGEIQDESALEALFQRFSD